MSSLETNVDVDKVVQQIKDSTSKAKLPTDVTTPTVTEISTDSQQLFSVYLANTQKDTSKDVLIKTAQDIQKKFEGKYNIESINIE